jgi:hypothetical protein
MVLAFNFHNHTFLVSFSIGDFGILFMGHTGRCLNKSQYLSKTCSSNNLTELSEEIHMSAFMLTSEIFQYNCGIEFLMFRSLVTMLQFLYSCSVLLLSSFS